MPRKYVRKTPKIVAPPVSDSQADTLSTAALTSEEQAVAEAVGNDPLPTVGDQEMIEIWERRFLNPGARPSEAVQIKQPGMTLRWINTAIEGRHHRAVYDQGWQPVPLSQLRDPASIPDLFKHPHGIVCRGERGKEVLMMMPSGVFEKIQRRKAELTRKSLQNIREEVAGAAANRFGADAGDFIASGQSADGNIKAVGSINFGTERVSMGDN